MARLLAQTWGSDWQLMRNAGFEDGEHKVRPLEPVAGIVPGFPTDERAQVDRWLPSPRMKRHDAFPYARSFIMGGGTEAGADRAKRRRRTICLPVRQNCTPVLGAGALDARSIDRLAAGHRRACRGAHHCGIADLQRRPWRVPGGARQCGISCAQVEACVEGFRRTRWPMDRNAGRRSRAR